MTDSILDAMTEQYNSMTRSGKKLANYILSNTAETQYLSITSLAENSGVSEATITRFCRMLGLNGYHELKLALAKSERANTAADSEDALLAVSDSGSLEKMCRNLRDSYLSSINGDDFSTGYSFSETGSGSACAGKTCVLFWTGGKYGNCKGSLGAVCNSNSKVYSY